MSNEVVNVTPSLMPAVDEVGIVHQILSSLAPRDPDSRKRILQTVAIFFQLDVGTAKQERGVQAEQPVSAAPATAADSFSGHKDISPKDFLREKEPQTDVERVACLGFYLTHYRNTPHFKTVDISKLNTEAAQIKFTNAAVPVDNATKRGYLVPATKGNKQLGALGEQYVLALPDREKARAILAKVKPRRSGNRSKPENGTAAALDEETSE